MIHLAQAVSDIIRTTLGPRSMLKMLLDPNGGEQQSQLLLHSPFVHGLQQHRLLNQLYQATGPLCLHWQV